jgi:8-oxo-dGDP phosphatase
MTLDAELPRFTKVGERRIHQGRVIEVVQADFTGPGGETFTRDLVRSPGAVAVVPVAEGADGPEAVLVRQFRPALGEWLLEIPAGLRDKPGESPELTASRELAEEVGLAAGRYELLTLFVNAAGMTDQRTYVYVAEDLSEVSVASDGVEEEYMEVVRFPLADVRAAISGGVLTDAKTVIGLLLTCARFEL